MTGTGPRLDRVDVTEPGCAGEHGHGQFLVTPVWRDVDRPVTCGMYVRRRDLAARLAAAIRAGVAVTPVRVGTTKGPLGPGRTYVVTKWHVHVRQVNADLRRLGF